LSKILHHHSDSEKRADLTGEHKLGDAGQIIIFIIFLAVWVVDSFFLDYTTFINTHVNNVVQITLGATVMIIAGYMALTGLNIVFNEVRETPQVIRKSVFKIVRHPIYISEMLFYLGMLCFSVSLAAAAVWVIAIAFLHYISRYEETLLLARFGEEYGQYMVEVPMYLPRIFGRHKKS
jgi:protein-S-isoprenylcysteine O-methyltransferase Ste14